MRVSRSPFFAAIALAASSALAGQFGAATLYKNPQCGCCNEYAKYLEQNGFDVTLENTTDISPIKQQQGVPEQLAGCHTMLIDGYVVEGLVPLDVLTRLLTEKPAIKGISLPGMPVGAPGMPGPKAAPFTIYEISDGPEKVYATE